MCSSESDGSTTSTSEGTRFTQLTWWLVGAIALVWLGRFGLALGARLAYPYDLEWMEGGMLAHATQLRALYGAPRPDFVPFIYPPGYPALLALFGPSPLIGRGISLVGTLLAAGALASMHQDRRIGASVAVVFLATWNAGGAFFDLVRPDGLALGLLTAALALFWHGRRGSSALLVAALLVKHSVLFFFPAFWIGVWARYGRRAALKAVLSTVLPSAAIVGVLQVWSGGWMLTYLVGLPASHPTIWSRLFPLAWLEIGAALPVVSFASATVLLLRTPGPTGTLVGIPVCTGVVLSTTALLTGSEHSASIAVPAGLGLGALGALGTHLLLTLSQGGWRRRFLTGLTACALVSAVWMRAHQGGFINVLIPAFWVTALGSGLALQTLRTPWIAPSILAAQLVLQLYSTPFTALTPTERDRRAGDELVERLRRVQGPIWSPYAVWLPTYAGHAPQAHLIGIWDLDHEGGPLQQEMQVFTEAIRDQHWGAVITSQRTLGFGIEQAYERRTELHPPPGALEPKSGWPVRLTGIWTPRVNARR